MPIFKSSKQRGLTLIEVIAAAALVSTLLVTTMLAFTSSSRQIREAKLRRDAAHACDLLIAEWFALDTFPRSDSGSFENQPLLVWKTSTRPSGLEQEWKADTLRLEVLDKRHQGAQTPLFVIELLIRRGDPGDELSPPTGNYLESI